MWEAVQLVGLPLGFGLIGFVEPCSVGANFVFLSYLRARPAAERFGHTLTFVLSRSIFLGLLGGGVAWMGRSILGGSYLYSAGLGGLYFLLGLLALGIYYGLFNLPSGDLGAWLQRKSGLALPMGVVFGMSAPTCAGPLLLALLGKAGISGVANGFISLALFGLALSAPLLVIAKSRRASDLLSRVGRHSSRVLLFAGVILILVGFWSIVIGWKGLPV
ncbi:MAG: cytochrome c biogenesis protein CcdA [Nitrospinota bacterium]